MCHGVCGEGTLLADSLPHTIHMHSFSPVCVVRPVFWINFSHIPHVGSFSDHLQQSAAAWSGHSRCSPNLQEVIRAYWMPFSLLNSSLTYVTKNNVLQGLIGKNTSVLLDDILIVSQTQEEHFDKLNQVFTTLVPAALKVKLEKCHFL